MNEASSRTVSLSSTTRDVLLIAAWFGLATGLIEGSLFVAFQRLGRVMHVTADIVWIATVFDLVLFGLLGSLLVVMARLFPTLPVTQFSVSCSTFFALADWLAIAFYERISSYGIALLAAGLAAAFTRWFSARQPLAMGFFRKTWKWLALLALLAGAGVLAGEWVPERVALAKLRPGSADLPNVLVIVVDALRADHLSSYGYGRRTSPNIDRLAQRGVLFENAFAASSYSLASHASLLSGLYPHQHRAQWDHPMGFRDCHCLTLAEALRSRGYRTAAFSANPFWFTHEYGFDRGFIRFGDYFHSLADMALRTLYGRAIEHGILVRVGWDDIPGRKRAPDVNRAALRWIEGEPGKPFLVFLNYFDAHDPYLPPHPYRGRFSSMEEPGGTINEEVRGLTPKLTPAQRQGEIDAYDGAIAFVDEYVGRLVAALQDRGLAKQTVIVITSDHGEAFGEHGMYMHGHSLYREVIHVPLIFWYPQLVPPHISVTRPVSNAAIPATIMKLVTAGGDAAFPGRPLNELWERPAASAAWPYPVSELVKWPRGPKGFPSSRGAMKSLVSPSWHCIVHDTLGLELYDTRHDNDESHNMGHDEGARDAVRACTSQLQQLPASP